MIYISLGSNIGHRLNNLMIAKEWLSKFMKNIHCSIILETKAICTEDAPEEWRKAKYLNMVIKCETELSNYQVLYKIKEIEKYMGRQLTTQKWAPRIIDIDILLGKYEKEIIAYGLKLDKKKHIVTNNINNDLIIPHAQLLNRPFLIHLIALLDSNRVYYGQNSNSPYEGKTFGEIAFFMREKVQFCNSMVVYPKLFGILNITPDSFSDGGLHYEPQKALNQSISLFENGAFAIDIGAQSTRPKAQLIDEKTEYKRILPVLQLFQSDKNFQALNPIISLDSFSSYVIRKVIDNFQVDFINDVTGKLDTNTLRYIAKKKKKIICMHSLSIPASPTNIMAFRCNIVDKIMIWGKQKINLLINLGFHIDNIVLDPGIGFGKSWYQNLEIIKNIHKLKSLGCKILIGHSRKRYFNSCSQLLSNKDLETISHSNFLRNKNIDFLRVHNISDHQRFLVANDILK